MNDELLRRHSAHYGPMLDAIQEILETATGPLVWRDRDDARLLDDRSLMQVLDPVVRVGPVFGCGVATAAIDQVGLVEAVNRLVTGHGFRPLGALEAEPWGLLHCNANDGYESTLHVELFGYAKAWVDVMVR